MKFNDVIEFKKDIYFEGAVQADWFYNQEKSKKVAENYVFHGNEYFDGILAAKDSYRIDSISFIKKIASKFKDSNSNPLSLAIADYGTGKSHLAVTLAHLLSGPNYCPNTFRKIIENIKKIDSSEGENIASFFQEKNLVLMLNGINDFNLNAEILKTTLRSLKLYNIDDSFINKLNSAQETARVFLNKTKLHYISNYQEEAKKYNWNEEGESLIKKLNDNFLIDDVAFKIVNNVYSDITGQEINWTTGITAGSVLNLLIDELCGPNKPFEHLIILFDEFGRFLEYVSNTNNSIKTGDVALQQIFEVAQNANGKLQVVNFIQSDIKTYLQRVDQTSNINRYIGRYDASDKYYISSNLETVFANLIYRKNRKAFEEKIMAWQTNDTLRWKNTNANMNRWLPTKGIWNNYRTFRDFIVEGIYPLHPLSTYMLTHLSDYLQSRSSLAIINSYIVELKDIDLDKEIPLIMPEHLMEGDLFLEMLAAEESGRQGSQYCIAYNSIITKIGDKLSNNAKKILRSNLILRLLKFSTKDRSDVILAISVCSGLSTELINKELTTLEHEYAVLGFDSYANCFDFMAEANGYHDYKIVKSRKLSNIEYNTNDIYDVQIKKLFEVENKLETDFNISHNIQTDEWMYQQFLYRIEDFNEDILNEIIRTWKDATSAATSKGFLIWIYINKNTLPGKIEKLKNLSLSINNKPIIIMLLNDTTNSIINYIQEFKCLLDFDDLTIKKYEKYFNEDFIKVRSNITDSIMTLKKQRLCIRNNSVEEIPQKMSKELSKVFEDIYTEVIPFNFDGFTRNHGYQSYIDIIKLLLSNSIDYDSILNFPIDVRNRIETIFSTEAAHSWKCLTKDYKITKPEQIYVKHIYEDILDNYNKNNLVKLDTIFTRYTVPPYGICDEILILIISLFVANNSYGLKFKIDSREYTINEWKDTINPEKKNFSDTDKKRIINNYKKAAIIRIDIGAVEDSYLQLFNQIDNNKDLKLFTALKNKLEIQLRKEPLPDELHDRYLISEQTLNTGLSHFNTWNNKLQEYTNDSKYLKININIPKSIELQYKIKNITKDYADIYTLYDNSNLDFDICKLLNENEIIIKDNFTNWLKSFECNTQDDVINLKSINLAYNEKLKEIGLEEIANRLQDYVNDIVKNISSIQEKNNLLNEVNHFVLYETINNNTSIQRIEAIYNESLALITKITTSKFNSEFITKPDFLKLKQLNNFALSEKNKFNNEIENIKKDISSLQNVNSIETIQNRINILRGKGLDFSTNQELEIFSIDSNNFIRDYKQLDNISDSLVNFNKTKAQLLEKYETPRLNFSQLKLLKSKIDNIEINFEFLETKWRSAYIPLKDTSMNSIITWKNNINILPDYLSEKTLKDLENEKLRVEGIISSKKIDTVLGYFTELSLEEKITCFEKIKSIIDTK